jgi:GntR family transcriptional repressor for pyruvate dehydrogenase complex
MGNRKSNVAESEPEELDTERPPPPSSRPTDPPASIASTPPSSPPVSRRTVERDADGRPRHAADPVYEKLASAILDGSLAPGSALPPERELSERFGVSRLIVRQAIHRLADVGLVRVRQGGPSIVVHPNDAKDLRVIDLVYRLGQRGAREHRELIERQFLHGHALLALAARRASKERLRAIAAMAEEYAARGAPGDEMMEFEKRFFHALAEATDNRFYLFETTWWFRMIEGRESRPPVFTDEQRVTFYREIARRLVEDKDAARFYLETLSPILDMIGSLSLGAR